MTNPVTADIRTLETLKAITLSIIRADAKKSGITENEAREKLASRRADAPIWDSGFDTLSGLDIDTAQKLINALALVAAGKFEEAVSSWKSIYPNLVTGAKIEEDKPKVARDDARQDGVKKERRPDITKWIKEQLERTPDIKSPDLWATAPEWLTDQIGEGRFGKRVTEVRKGRK